MTFNLSIRSKADALIAAFAALIAASAGASAEDHSPVINVPSRDAEMATAIAKARASLSAFWASYNAPKPSEGGHSPKVRFPNPHNGGEHIWMMEVKRLPNGRYSGRFGNAPMDLPGKHEGDLCRVH